jgi:Gametolysin peptidase M11
MACFHLCSQQNLHHAGEGTNEYGDQTGMMGYSYSKDDQYMCFNAVNNYQLQWFPSQVGDVDTSATMADQSFVMNGVETAGASGKMIAVRLKNVFLEHQNTDSGAPVQEWRDIYIGYNYASTSGINRESAEYKNRVTIHQKDPTKPYAAAKSWLLQALTVGQVYTIPNFDNAGQGRNLHIQFVGVSGSANEDAFVEVFVEVQLPPTGAPSSQPSVAPTRSPAPTAACCTLTVEITTDNYPGETTWSLANGASEVLMSGGPYSAQATTVTQTACIEEGYHSFTINDR